MTHSGPIGRCGDQHRAVLQRRGDGHRENPLAASAYRQSRIKAFAVRLGCRQQHVVAKHALFVDDESGDRPTADVLTARCLRPSEHDENGRDKSDPRNGHQATPDREKLAKKEIQFSRYSFGESLHRSASSPLTSAKGIAETPAKVLPECPMNQSLSDGRTRRDEEAQGDTTRRDDDTQRDKRWLAPISSSARVPISSLRSCPFFRASSRRT